MLFKKVLEIAANVCYLTKRYSALLVLSHPDDISFQINFYCPGPLQIFEDDIYLKGSKGRQHLAKVFQFWVAVKISHCF